MTNTTQNSMNIVNAAWYQRGPWPQDTVYIGRNASIYAQSGGTGPIIFGNKFPVALCGTLPGYPDQLHACIRADLGHQMLKMLDPQYRTSVQELSGKNLACHCAPKPCHGHNIRLACESTQDNGPNFPTPTRMDTIKFLQSMGKDAHLFAQDPIRPMLRTLAQSMMDHDGVSVHRGVFSTQDTTTIALSTSSTQALIPIGQHITHNTYTATHIQAIARGCLAIQESQGMDTWRNGPAQTPTHTPSPTRRTRRDHAADMF